MTGQEPKNALRRTSNHAKHHVSDQLKKVLEHEELILKFTDCDHMLVGRVERVWAAH